MLGALQSTRPPKRLWLSDLVGAFLLPERDMGRIRGRVAFSGAINPGAS